MEPTSLAIYSIIIYAVYMLGVMTTKRALDKATFVNVKKALLDSGGLIASYWLWPFMWTGMCIGWLAAKITHYGLLLYRRRKNLKASKPFKE